MLVLDVGEIGLVAFGFFGLDWTGLELGILVCFFDLRVYVLSSCAWIYVVLSLPKVLMGM